MKKAIYSAILLFVLSYSTATAQTTFKTGIEYNDFIVAEQVQIGQLITKFNDLVGANNFSEARTMLSGEMLTQTRIIISKIKRMPAYNGDTQLRDAAAALFGFYLGCFENEYSELLSILAKSDFTTADEENMNQILQTVADNEKKYDEAFSKAQTAFAEKNGFTLSE